MREQAAAGLCSARRAAGMFPWSVHRRAVPAAICVALQQGSAAPWVHLIQIPQVAAALGSPLSVKASQAQP